MKTIVAGLAAGSLLLASGAQAETIFLSTVDTVGGGVAVGTPDLEYQPAAIGTVHRLSIWVTDELLVDRGLAVSIAVTGDASVVDLVGAQALNFQLLQFFNSNGTLIPTSPQGNRWASVGTGTQINSDLIANLNATTASDTGGIRPENDGAPANFQTDLLDAGYDVAAGAFLYGWVDFELTGEGTAQIALQQSPLGIAQGGTDISGQYTYGSATINVVPEPASLALLGLGGLALLRRRR